MTASYFLLLAAAGLLLPGASARAATPTDPADPKATVPPLVYKSSLKPYKPQTETEVADWRAANERVRQAGGWRAYARESAASAPTTTPAAASSHKH